MKIRSSFPLLILMILVILFVAMFSTKIFGESRSKSSRELTAPKAKVHLQVFD